MANTLWRCECLDTHQHIHAQCLPFPSVFHFIVQDKTFRFWSISLQNSWYKFSITNIHAQCFPFPSVFHFTVLDKTFRCWSISLQNALYKFLSNKHNHAMSSCPISSFPFYKFRCQHFMQRKLRTQISIHIHSFVSPIFKPAKLMWTCAKIKF